MKPTNEPRPTPLLAKGFRRRRTWGLFAVALGALAAGPGCLSYVHRIPPPPPAVAAPCLAAPRYGRDHVYVFMVHGLDPFNLANLSGLRDYVQGLGFGKTYYGQLYHVEYFRDEIRKIHETDPEAHFVLIGFSFGANVVRSLANMARDDGVTIDLLVYLGGNTLGNTDRDQPENVQRVVNVLALGAIWNGAQMDRAENINVTDVLHFGSPTHPRTLEALARNLAEVAAEVPVPAPTDDPAMPPAGEAPTPRPVTKATRARPPGWDFLRPVSRLKLPAAPAEKAPADPKSPPPVAPDRIASRPAVPAG